MAHVEQGSRSTTEPWPAATSIEVAAGGGIAEAVSGLAAVVLSILGIGGILPTRMMSIGCIAVGAALLFAGGAVASRYSRQLEDVLRGRSQPVNVGRGIAGEALAGAIGVVLGILALLGKDSVLLVAIASIVFGAGLLLGGGVASRVGGIPRFYQRGDVERVTREAVFARAGGQALLGAFAIVLGILALLGLAPTTLSLIALLVVGGSLVIGGTAIGARMLSVLRRA